MHTRLPHPVRAWRALAESIEPPLAVGIGASRVRRTLLSRLRVPACTRTCTHAHARTHARASSAHVHKVARVHTVARTNAYTNTNAGSTMTEDIWGHIGEDKIIQTQWFECAACTASWELYAALNGLDEVLDAGDDSQEASTRRA